MPTVLQLQGISKSFGNRRLFDDATVSISEGQRVGLIGANGTGKTTLLRMIIGQESVDDGDIVFYPTTRLGYLEQQEEILPNETVMEYLVRASSREPWECAKMAGAFELKHEQLEKRFLNLSGGYQMRVRLAGILVQEPNLLLLDEPTNYLDLQTVLLLEAVLRQYRGALLLVSHDREFIKNVCNYTLELEHQKLTLFAGDVETYFADKEMRLEEARRHNKKIQAHQRHLQAFVDRFRYKASKATQAQSKLKQLERLKTIEIAHSIRTVRIQLPMAPQRKATALECMDVTVGYAHAQPILRSVDIEIQRGEHMAVLGENGNGKSTLLKTLAGELPPLSGRFKWGHGLSIAYYAQHVTQMLPKEGTAGTYLSSVSATVLPEELLRMAGNFLLTKEDLEKPISFLSGGERARLCLAAICLARHDVLILDEPTNHLDFDTVEALGEALSEFEGTIIFVSHSRTFVAEIATSILEVKDGHAIRYPYPYDLYVHELKTHERFELPQEEGSMAEGVMPEAFIRRKSEIYADVLREKRALHRLELEMEELTQEKQNLQNSFIESSTKLDIEKTKRLKHIDEELLEHESMWFAKQAKVAEFEQELKMASE